MEKGQKEQVKIVMDAVAETGVKGRECGESDCSCPDLVVYVVWSKCLTINNGACSRWRFCKPGCGTASEER